MEHFKLTLLNFTIINGNIINMKILVMLIGAGIIGFALLMAFSFILSLINSSYINYINNFFFSDLFTLITTCIVIGLPFSLIYYRNKNIK